MANVPPHLPPQAYTRDVLAAAYEWLRSQPTAIRELATSSDNLVSLYMQSRRRPNTLPPTKEAAAMSSASAEAFKNDLKNLAEGMKQFEDPTRTTSAPQVEIPQPQMPPDMSFLNATPSYSGPTYATPTYSNPLPQPSVQPTYAQQQAPSAQPQALALDPRSLDTVRKVQSLFNLSNEREALRLLISIGFEKVKDIISNN